MHRGDRRDHLAVQLLRERGRGCCRRCAGPASTCITGIRRWKAESAAAIAELVSPWTRTSAGWRALEHVLAGRQHVGVDVEALDAEVFEALHHRGDALVQRGAARAGPERHVGLDVGELEDVLDQAVVLAGRDDDRVVVLALAQGEDQRDELDRLGTGADDDRDLQLLVAWVRYRPRLPIILSPGRLRSGRFRAGILRAGRPAGRGSFRRCREQIFAVLDQLDPLFERDVFDRRRAAARRRSSGLAAFFGVVDRPHQARLDRLGERSSSMWNSLANCSRAAVEARARARRSRVTPSWQAAPSSAESVNFLGDAFEAAAGFRRRARLAGVLDLHRFVGGAARGGVDPDQGERPRSARRRRGSARGSRHSRALTARTSAPGRSAAARAGRSARRSRTRG